MKMPLCLPYFALPPLKVFILIRFLSQVNLQEPGRGQAAALHGLLGIATVRREDTFLREHKVTPDWPLPSGLSSSSLHPHLRASIGLASSHLRLVYKLFPLPEQSCSPTSQLISTHHANFMFNGLSSRKPSLISPSSGTLLVSHNTLGFPRVQF